MCARNSHVQPHITRCEELFSALEKNPTRNVCDLRVQAILFTDLAPVISVQELFAWKESHFPQHLVRNDM